MVIIVFVCLSDYNVCVFSISKLTNISQIHGLCIAHVCSVRTCSYELEFSAFNS